MAEEIPVVCRHCGRSEGFSQYGEVEVRTEVWRSVKATWDPAQNALVITEGRVESDISGWELDDAIEDCNLANYACSACGASARSLDELVAPKYGCDRWGRVLDERGEAHGPMVVHPNQMTFEGAA